MILELLQKDNVVCSIEFDEDLQQFREIIGEVDYQHAPFAMSHRYNFATIPDKKMLNDWFNDRAKIRNKSNKEEMHLGENWYAVSLSDLYWFREKCSSLKWEDINFFKNNYQEEKELGVYENINSPNTTTSGNVEKTWIKENGINYLLKGSSFDSKQEPLCEKLASEIFKELKIDHVSYVIDKYNQKVVSKCPCMISENEELIDANTLLKWKKKDNNASYFSHYKKLLLDLEINDLRDLNGMFLVDCIMSNRDRHLGNFGVIHNIIDNTYRLAPVYDTGYSLGAEKNSENILTANIGKFFNDTEIRFDDLIKKLDHIERFDLTNLKNIKDKLFESLLKGEKDFGLSKERLSIISELFDRNLFNVQRYQESYIEKEIISEYKIFFNNNIDLFSKEGIKSDTERILNSSTEPSYKKYLELSSVFSRPCIKDSLLDKLKEIQEIADEEYNIKKNKYIYK